MSGDWERALAGFLQRLHRRGAAPATCRKLRCRVLQLQEFVGRDLAELRGEDLTAFLAQLRTRVQLATAVETVARLRPFLRWACRGGYLFLDPTPEVELPTVTRPSVPALSEAQLRRLLGTCDPTTPAGLRDLSVLETLYGTGLRHTEAHGLALSDLDLAERTLLVRHGKSGPRLAPLGGHLVRVLTSYLERSRGQLARPATQALWVANNGVGLGYNGLREVILRAGERAGFPVTAHALRRAFATHLLRHGARLQEVQLLLGHRCLKATELYTSLTVADLATEYARTHPRARARRHD